MVNAGGVGRGAFEIFNQIRETVVFYMFIQEEAIQTLSMAVFLAQGRDDWQEVEEMAKYTRDEHVEDLHNQASNVLANVAFPMNLAFQKFTNASRTAMNYYIDMAHQEEGTT